MDKSKWKKKMKKKKKIISIDKNVDIRFKVEVLGIKESI